MALEPEDRREEMKTGKLKSVGVVTLLADETPRLGWRGGRG